VHAPVRPIICTETESWVRGLAPLTGSRVYRRTDIPGQFLRAFNHATSPPASRPSQLPAHKQPMKISALAYSIALAGCVGSLVPHRGGAQVLPTNSVPSAVRQGYATRFPGTRKTEWKRKTD